MPAKRIYLDHAATTPMTAPARRAVTQAMRQWANPSSPHAEGRAARAALEAAREQICASLGWKHSLLFTSGASESLALAMNRAMVERKILTAVEHDAVMRHSEGATVVPVGRAGRLDPGALHHALEGPRALVTVQWANSETGVRQDITRIAQQVHAAGSLLLVDAAQMPAGADPAVMDHADFVALSAHKRGGPVGIGALLVRDLATLLPTGGQERGYRPGTENLPGVLGYAAALAVPEPDRRHLRHWLDRTLVAAGGEVIASRPIRHLAIGSYRMPGVASAVQLIRFDALGFAVSAGSACASGSLKPSHVLAAMGYDSEAAREVIRVSFGRRTTHGEVRAFAEAWQQVAGEVRNQR